jgi:hypothetical protein
MDWYDLWRWQPETERVQSPKAERSLKVIHWQYEIWHADACTPQYNAYSELSIVA